MTYKNIKFDESEIMRSYLRVAHEKGLIKPDEIRKVASLNNEKLDFSHSDNLMINITKLCEGLRHFGFAKKAEELEEKFVELKKADALYSEEDNGEDFILDAHEEGDVKISDSDDDHGTIRTNISKHKKILEVVRAMTEDGQITKKGSSDWIPATCDRIIELFNEILIKVNTLYSNEAESNKDEKYFYYLKNMNAWQAHSDALTSVLQIKNNLNNETIIKSSCEKIATLSTKLSGSMRSVEVVSQRPENKLILKNTVIQKPNTGAYQDLVKFTDEKALQINKLIASIVNYFIEKEEYKEKNTVNVKDVAIRLGSLIESISGINYDTYGGDTKKKLAWAKYRDGIVNGLNVILTGINSIGDSDHVSWIYLHDKFKKNLPDNLISNNIENTLVTIENKLKSAGVKVKPKPRQEEPAKAEQGDL